MIRRERVPLAWQSKVVLLLVLPVMAPAVLLESNWWLTQVPAVAATTLGISVLFGLIVWRVKAGTWRAAMTGAAITACLMYGTTEFPYQNSWLRGGLLPLLSVFLLTFIATKIGRAKKLKLGVAESRTGRNAAQVAANLGVAALAVVIFPLSSLVIHFGGLNLLAYMASMAALAEAAADTVSSEIGQVLGGKPRMITTLRRVEAGTDGGITVAGTVAGMLAALLVASVACWAMHAERNMIGQWPMIAIVAGSGVVGLLFDSVVGATLEQNGWINNDAVNFISTLVAAISAVGLVLWMATRGRV